MSNILKDMSGLYSNLKVNPSRKSGTLALDNRYGLRVDEDQKPDEWVIFDSQSGDFTEQSTVPPQAKILIKSFVDDWNKLSGYPAKDPIDNLKAGGFELPETPEKIDEEELKTSEEEEKKITEMERREKAAEAAKAAQEKENAMRREENEKRLEMAMKQETEHIQDAVYEDVEPATLPAPTGICGIVRPAVSVAEALAAWKEFQALKNCIIEKSDIQVIQGKNFIKKSGWRKFATFYNLTDKIVEETQVPLEKGGYYWKIKVICTAPNGRQTEGVGMCSSLEKSGARQLHDVYTTAHTRSKNRAISDMIAAGEVSAEEMD